uniref:Symplekin C-terminal domain-containing protein n=2 Tax=Lotharella globosa TaxID=91324 RepID=A0A7S3YRP5_9EUKA
MGRGLIADQLKQIVNLPKEKMAQRAIKQLMLPSSPFEAAELMVMLHDLSADPNVKPAFLKRLLSLVHMCMKNREVYKAEQLAVALRQMLDRQRLPKLLMRTLIITLKTYPQLKDFGIEMLATLVRRRVWDDPHLWKGFLKCAIENQPAILLQLPIPQIKSMLLNNKSVRQPLIEFARVNRNVIRIRREVLDLLGLN